MHRHQPPADRLGAPGGYAFRGSGGEIGGQSRVQSAQRVQAVSPSRGTFVAEAAGGVERLAEEAAGLDQEMAAAGGGVYDSQAQDGQRVGVVVGAGGGDQGTERVADQEADELMGGVVGSGGFPAGAGAQEECSGLDGIAAIGAGNDDLHFRASLADHGDGGEAGLQFEQGFVDVAQVFDVQGTVVDAFARPAGGRCP